MKSSRSLEYSTFGVQNPFSAEIPLKHEVFTDAYMVILGSTSLKTRDGEKVKFKQHIARIDDVDVFDHHFFPYDASQDPLRSFLELHRFNLSAAPLFVVTKERSLYRLEETEAWFCNLSVGGQQFTNLTIVGNHIDPILSVREELNLRGNNINYAQFLTEHEHP